MIFLTVGSQKFQFDRLLMKVDQLIVNKMIDDRVFAQTGYSNYIPQNFNHSPFLDVDAFRNKISESDIVITHGGTGVIISSVKAGKKVIAVPRLKKYNEHVDDHQLELLRSFDDMGIISVCYNLENLFEKYVEIRNIKFTPYKSNTEAIINSIEDFIIS